MRWQTKLTINVWFWNDDDATFENDFMQEKNMTKKLSMINQKSK